MDQNQLTILFNEWARRYAANPAAFQNILDANGNVISDYGRLAAVHFLALTDELGFTKPK